MKKTLLTFFIIPTLVSFLFARESSLLPCPLSYEENVLMTPRNGSIFTERLPDQSIANHPLRFYKYLNKDLAGAPEVFLDGLTLVFLEAPETKCFIKHYFHLLEHVVGSYACFASNPKEEVKNIFILSDGHYHLRPWRGPNQMNEHLLRAIFPSATVWTPSDLVRTFKKSTIQLEKALFSDRLVSFSHPLCQKTSKMLAVALHHIPPKKIEDMALLLRDYFGIQRESSENLRVTYVARRDPPRFMKPELERKLMRKLEKMPEVQAQTVDFATISYKNQIQIINNTDVLLGIHGNGLSHLLFLPKHAAVIELFPPDAQALDYRLYADAKGLRYYGVICNQGIKDKDFAYEHGMFGNLNQEIKDLDVNLIVDIIKRELELFRSP